MPPIQAVLFDVYETLLVNGLREWEATFREICRLQGLPADPRRLHAQWKVHEQAFRRSRVNLKDPPHAPPFKNYFEAWHDCFRLVFQELGLRGDPRAAAHTAVRAMAEREPYPDALEALPFVQARWPTGVLSNADDAFLFRALQRHALKFPMVLSSEGARAYKPAPEAFRKALQMLGAGPSETVYVGDSLYDDVLGAKLVGIRAVWLNRDGRPIGDSPPAPDYEIRKLTELVAALEKEPGFANP